MFVRVKGNEPNRYLQMVENRRLGERTLQRVVATRPESWNTSWGPG